MTTVVAPVDRGAPADDGPAVLRRARELASAVYTRGLEIERERNLPPDLVAQLRESGLLRMALPGRLGGSGTEPRVMVEVIEEMSRADGATGWNVLTANIGCAYLAWLEPEAADQILAAGTVPVMAGSAAPRGQAVRAGDGYRLSGRWPFASGCSYADWFVGGFMVTIDGRPETDRWGAPMTRLAYFPASRARVEDTWRAAGLAGTGSHDVVAERITVPAAHTSVPFFEPPGYPDPLCRLTAYNVLLTMLSGFAFGVARRALDEICAQLAERPRPDTQPDWLDEPAVQIGLLRHETALAAARRQMLATLAELLGEPAGGAGGYPQRARLAAAVVHGYDVAREAVLDCFRFGGGRALFEGNPLQRCMRDLVAATQHLAFSVDSRLRIANALLGRQTGPVFFGV